MNLSAQKFIPTKKHTWLVNFTKKNFFKYHILSVLPKKLQNQVYLLKNITFYMELLKKFQKIEFICSKIAIQQQKCNIVSVDFRK